MANMSTTVAQTQVASMSTGVSAVPFTLIPAVNTFTPVTQHGGRGGNRGQAAKAVYGYADKGDADIAKKLTMDRARRIASNIARLPKLLGIS